MLVAADPQTRTEAERSGTAPSRQGRPRPRGGVAPAPEEPARPPSFVPRVAVPLRVAGPGRCGAGLGPRAPRHRARGGPALRVTGQEAVTAGPGPGSGRPPCLPGCREGNAQQHGAGSGLGRAGAALRRFAAHRRGLAAPVLAVGGSAIVAAAGAGDGGGRGPGAARRAALSPVPAGAVAAGLGASPQRPGAPARGTAGCGGGR